jgi:hypothetical protein
VHPSIGTLIGIAQRNSLNFVFSDFGVAKKILRSSSRLNKDMARAIYNLAVYLI